MRLLTLVLAVLLVLIQYPLWLGDGGWLKVWDRERKLAAQLKTNDELRMRNAALEAEVRDLRDGTAAIEERARYELNMIRADEIFVQFVDPKSAGQSSTGQSSGSTAAPTAQTASSTPQLSASQVAPRQAHRLAPRGMAQ